MAFSISSSIKRIGKSSRKIGVNQSNISPSTNTVYEQYSKWCKTLKIELKQKSKINIDVRMNKIIKIVNNTISSDVSFERNENGPFYILDDDKQEIMRQIEDKIDLWRGVEIEVCRNKEKKSFQAYQATARNWFNRNKAKVYGNHLFYVLIFKLILKFCAELNNMSLQQKMVIFIEIFESILNEPVQFPRTKLQPLLPHQALMQPNKFKKACEQFTMHYNIRWMLTHKENKRDRDRAKKIHNSFLKCLAEIKDELQTSSMIQAMPYPFDVIMNETGFGSIISKSMISIPRNDDYEEITDDGAEREREEEEEENKLIMFDDPSGNNTESTDHISYCNNDCYPNLAEYDEYDKYLPPNIEGINGIIDEVVYDDRFQFKNNINVNEINLNYYDCTSTVNHGGYDQNNYNNQYQSNYNDNNNNNNDNNDNKNNNNNNNNKYVHDANMLCIDDGIQCLSSIQVPNIGISIQPPYSPQTPYDPNSRPNRINLPHLHTLPVMNHTNHPNHQQYEQNNINMLPSTSLQGQFSSSSSDNTFNSLSYAPFRGTTNYNVSQKRFSPINTPKTPNTQIQTNYDYSDYHNNYNQQNTSIIDTYQLTPFSPSHSNINHNQCNSFPFNQHQQQQQQQQQSMSYNPMVNSIDFGVNNNNNNNNNNYNQNEGAQYMINNNNTNNNNNDNFVFTNLSKISSPTPLLGGFL